MSQNQIQALPAARRFHLTGIKKRVLADLAEYFCLTTNDLVDLTYGTQTETHRRSMRRTLSILHEENLLNKLPYLDLDAAWGGRTFAYGLSDRGVKLIRDDDFLLSNSVKTFDEHSERTLDHELAISHFHVALKRFALTSGLELHWKQTDLKRGIHPDAYFSLTDPEEPDDRNTHNFFLEIERAKKGFDSLLAKLGRFYDLYGTDECEKRWGFRQFRVTLVQKNDARRQSLLSVLASRYNHRMFWLTTESFAKADVGGDIFKTPKDTSQKTHSLQSLYPMALARKGTAETCVSSCLTPSPESWQ